MARQTSLNGQLRYPVAAPLLRRLRQEGIAPEDLLLCTPTDIDRMGNYARQWFVLTRSRVLVIGDRDDAPVLLSLPLEDVSEFRLQPGVGSGMLTAQLARAHNGLMVDVLRYSNREAYRFERVVQKLEQHRRGEGVEITHEDEHDPRRCEKCGMMLDQPGEPCSYCVRRGAVLWRMAKLMVPYRRSAATMMVLLLVGVALDLVSPQLTRYLVDHVFVPASEAGAGEPDREARISILVWIVGILAGVQVVRMIVNIINGRLGSRVGTAITYDMRGRLVNHLQRLSISFYDKQQVGSLVGRIAYDTESLHGLVWQLTNGFLLQILMVVGVGIMMFSIDPMLALYALLPAPLVMGCTVFFWRFIYPRYYRTWDASSKQAGALSGMLSGVRVIKAFNQEERELNRFNQSSRQLRASRHNVEAAIGTFNPVVGLIFQLGGWIVWYGGGRDVLDGRLTLGELMAFFGYLWMFYGPLAALPQFTNWLTQFVTQANRIFEILDTPVAMSEPEGSDEQREAMKGEIEFDRVVFGYNRHTPVLRGVNMHIRPGEMVGIVGQSGSGKTTLVNLLCRFYDVDDGCIRIDGRDVRQIPQGELRSQIGIVLQEPFIFRGSILENIAYGRPDASPEEILAASKAGNCHEFIIRQVHGYDTWVGERGAGLSGGERQRISVARALLADPRVLILDEATSSVDAESEAAIQGALAELTRGRTTIAIAHRLSTLRRADRIIVMKHGQVAEVGSHDELMADNGIYARLVRLQGQAATIDADAPGTDGADGAADIAQLNGEAPGREEASPLPPIDSHHLRWLDPSFAHIHTGSYNTLHVTIRNERIYGGVYAIRTMPVCFPSRYISLRYLTPDGAEHEVGLIRDIEEWPEEAQQLICEALSKRYFVHTIRAINDIRLMGNFLDFEVKTDRGPMRFTVRAQSDRVHDYGLRGKMVLDTDENRYLIPDVDALGEREQRLFQRHIYW